MTEQVTYEGKATVKRAEEVAIRYSGLVTGSPQAMTSLHSFTLVTPQPHTKTLAKRLNEAYDEDAEREDEEFFRTTKAYYRRRFHAED